MTHTSPSPLDFPALDGRGVTEAHARICAERGHAVHTVDGAVTGACPRCGEVTETAEITISDSSREGTHAHIAMTVPTATGPRTYFALLPDEDAVTGWITRANATARNYGMTVAITDTRTV